MNHVILFYKYHSLSEDRNVMEAYRIALEDLCRSLDLIGRILIGCSRNEGINGTLAGDQKDLEAFSIALLGGEEGRLHLDVEDEIQQQNTQKRVRAIDKFRVDSAAFFRSIGEPELKFESPNDFKWSTAPRSNDPLFPDLHIKLVPELIGTGGKLLDIPLDETAQGYLTPLQWHDRLQQRDSDTLLIDCRNSKEYEIGHFGGAIDTMTTTFSQFPKWVEDHKHEMIDKKVLMYCTGGIRCEKASAFIRRTVPSVKEVNHLKGGIHKYLEEFGSRKSGLFHGKNFVFDGRISTNTGSSSNCVEASSGDVFPSQEIVGHCICCEAPFDEFHPKYVCTVCREPLLVCLVCRRADSEYHCKNHAHLGDCYFTNLQRYNTHELIQQRKMLLDHLRQISVGRRYRQKRKTLLKQVARIDARLGEGRCKTAQDSSSGARSGAYVPTIACRSCGEQDCDGKCWGFHSLSRKRKLDERPCSTGAHLTWVGKSIDFKQEELSLHDTDLGRVNKIYDFACTPPYMNRDPSSGIRVPELTMRTLSCQTKAKWCGESLSNVVQNQFSEMNRPGVLRHTIDNGLLFVNGKVIASMQEASEYRLKNADCISRITHWHEAPVRVPERLEVKRVQIPIPFVSCDSDDSSNFVYVCNKPSTVPVHPAGPYFANSLTCMVEGQEELVPASLKPIHRTDRVTSGLTLLCTDSKVAKVFQRALSGKNIRKLYLARVDGRFPTTEDELYRSSDGVGRCEWRDNGVILVDAPVHTIDPAAGMRIVDNSGKIAISLFRAVWYDESSDATLVICQPITGRNHQLRVHLRWLGFPIVGDTQYGGKMLEGQCITDVAVELMLKRVHESSIKDDCQPRVKMPEDRAQQACDCCTLKTKEAILKAFNSAQLLDHGHEIQLHALKYKITLTNSSDSTKGVVSFKVHPPCWANGNGKRHADDFSFLEE